MTYTLLVVAIITTPVMSSYSSDLLCNLCSAAPPSLAAEAQKPGEISIGHASRRLVDVLCLARGGVVVRIHGAFISQSNIQLASLTPDCGCLSQSDMNAIFGLKSPTSSRQQTSRDHKQVSVHLKLLESNIWSIGRSHHSQPPLRLIPFKHYEVD
ncbi:hypothetical protein B0T17DRAFT_528253 [Bombardia bombarda]|uniref:Uncharacterized protein n=1 Tax=Bombardia bombarda TaxID=252184 RepID=A0AA39XAJ3_9PEZI|nr:hypothetical protein B0T17DRAFT_528253 [Bombardia bombarda]